MSDPFKSSKRQWKRYDPEPPEDNGEWRAWERLAWMAYVVAIVVLTAIILGNLTAPGPDSAPPATTTTVPR